MTRVLDKIVTEAPEIFGLNTDAESATRLMLTHVRPDWCELDRELFRVKWFDYRFLNPVQATYLYAHEFEKAYRYAYRRHKDATAADHIRVFKVEDIFQGSRHILSGLWRGRQVADAMGMPYAVYLNLAFHWTLRWWQQRHLPRPAQLYCDRVIDRVPADWESHQASRLYVSMLPQYANERYEGTPDQNDHHEWLFAQAEKRPNPKPLLARFAIADRILPDSKIAARYGAAMLDELPKFA